MTKILTTKVITDQPEIEPVTLVEAKAHLRVSVDTDDVYITALIVAAREIAEGYTERAFISQGWEFSLDRFPVGDIEVPMPPLSDVGSVKYFDGDNALQTFDAAEYYIDTRRKPGRLSPVDSWPDTYDRPNAVTVVFTAGYGATADSVPMPIRQAILLLVGEMYENREESIVGVSASPLPLTAERLLFPYRMLRA